MALTVAMPLFGLNPQNFCTLSAKLLQFAYEHNQGRQSPSSDSSGISSYVTSTTSSVEITPTSSRPATPIRLVDQRINDEKTKNINTRDKQINQDKENKKEIIYNGRDILKLGPNIRSTIYYQASSTARPDRQSIMRDFNNVEERNVRETPPCNDCNFSTSRILN